MSLLSLRAVPKSSNSSTATVSTPTLKLRLKLPAQGKVVPRTQSLFWQKATGANPEEYVTATAESIREGVFFFLFEALEEVYGKELVLTRTKGEEGIEEGGYKKEDRGGSMES
jgi:hypothetical protein